MKKQGPTGIRTRVGGFKVRNTNHYTIEPMTIQPAFFIYIKIEISEVMMYTHITFFFEYAQNVQVRMPLSPGHILS